MDEDETLRQALDGMLDEYMTLDPVTELGPDNVDSTNIPASIKAADSASGEHTSNTKTLNNISPSSVKLIVQSDAKNRSTVLDNSADVFSSLLNDIVNADAVSECSYQQDTALETAQRIVGALKRCNARLGHDFPVVQRDVMKCLNLVDSIRNDMQKTENSIARTKKLLQIDGIHQIPIDQLKSVKSDDPHI